MKRSLARVTDMTHMDEEPSSLSREAARIADFLGRIVAAASHHPIPETLVSVVRCRRRPNRKPCPGYIGMPASSDELQSLQAILGAEMDSASNRDRADRLDELWERIDLVLDMV